MALACLRWLGIVLLLAGHAGRVQSQEAVLDDQPVPAKVEELDGAFAASGKEAPVLPTLFPGLLKQRLAPYSPFFADSYLKLHLRSYYLDRDNDDDTESRAWAYGGWIEYRSGWWKEALAVEAKFFTSQRLYGPSDKDGTRLLAPGQRGYSTLGVANAQVRWPLHELTLYRQELRLPYVNRQDSRMTPNTFEGYRLRGDLPKLDYTVGYLTDMKKRDSDRFVSMSEAAGVPGHSDEGMLLGGFRTYPTEGLMLGAIDYWVNNVLNILYAELDFTRPLTQDIQWRIGAQFTDQRSVGSDLLTGSSFDTRVFGGRAALGYGGGILSAAFSSTDDEERIRNPFGSYPGYLSLMQRNFNRAGEDAWLVGLSYNFVETGVRFLDRLSFFSYFARGYDARDPDTGASLPDRHEINWTVDYKIDDGPLQGFWLRLRGSIVDSDGGGNSEELRLILNYDLPLL